jgi:MFS family permease
VVAAAPKRRGEVFASLRKHYNYRLFFTGQIVSVAGTWMQDTALPWLVLQMTHSPIDVGLLLFCRYVPFALLGLPAGVLADRFDTRRVMVATQSSSMVIAAALGILALQDTPPLWAIYVLATLGGAVTVLDSPSRNSLTYRLVGRDELPNAVALNSTFFNAGRVIGPAAAGVVIGSLGIAACFFLNAGSYLAVLAVLLLMRKGELFALDRGEEGSRRTIREGVSFVLGNRRLKYVMLLAFVIGMTGFNLRVLLPLLADDTLHAGATAFGLLWACFGIGALAGALFAAGTASARTRTLFVGLAAYSVALLLLAAARSTLVACGILIVLGAAFTIWTASGQSIVQLTAPDRLRGRVLAIWIFMLTGLIPLGSLLSAWLTDVGGTELAFFVGGLSGLAVTVLAAVRMDPGLWRRMTARTTFS